MRQDRLVLVDMQQNVVEGEMFGFPVPGEWPGGRDHTTEPARADDAEDPRGAGRLVCRLRRILLGWRDPR
ncbi:MAG: hypothetical protein ACRDLA_05075 [Thermoleophilaceae bacterium]